MDSRTEVEDEVLRCEAEALVADEFVRLAEQEQRLWKTFAEAATVETFCRVG